jgi:tetratricopeptide (TPR) repeat protein
MKHKAETSLLKATEMESWNAEPYAELGMLFYSERLYKRAEGYFRKALELEPSHTVARKKLEEIVGPEIKPMEKVQKTLGKVFPSFFGKKKK